MTYLTSWDINVILVLIAWGIPDDVVKRMMKITKKIHEEHSLAEAVVYWISNSPKLIRVSHPSRDKRLKFIVSNGNDIHGLSRSRNFRYRRANTIEFMQQWRLRSIELRKAKVVEWCRFGDHDSQRRHQSRLQNSAWGLNYTDNLWSSWEAGASSYYFVGQDRRNYISKWYEGIHPGRFFLFYRENKIIEVRHRHRNIPKDPCEDGYKYPPTPIFDLGPYEQLIEDLRCLDGPGIGEKAGSKIEHIDDLFQN